MTADAKVGLLLGLIFIVMIAFLINGLPNFLQTVKAEEAVNVAITLEDTEDLVIGDRVVEKAIELQRQDIPLRQTTPPQEVLVLDGSVQTDQQETSRVPFELPRQNQVVSTSKTHVVKSGENLALIAQKYYGKEEGNRRVVIQKLYEANDSILPSPDKVSVGQKLSIPPLDTLLSVSAESLLQIDNQANTQDSDNGTSFFDRFSNLFERSDRESAAQIHIVQDGESLWGIAEQMLGDGKRYKEILKLNKAIEDADDVVVGTRLKIPNP